MAAYFPLAVVTILTLGVNPYIFQLLLALLYPIAIWRDMNFMRKTSEWNPSSGRWVIAGIFVTLTLGIGSLIISPYYMYKRRNAARGGQ